MKGSSFERAVELRLGEISRRLAQDLVGLAQLAVLPFERLQLLRDIEGNASTLPAINLSPLDPLQQRVGRAADLGGDRGAGGLGSEAIEKVTG